MDCISGIVPKGTGHRLRDGKEVVEREWEREWLGDFAKAVG